LKHSDICIYYYKFSFLKKVLSTLNQNYKWGTKIKFANEYCFNLHYYSVFIDQFYVVGIPSYVHIKVEQNCTPTKNIEYKIKIYDQESNGIVYEVALDN